MFIVETVAAPYYLVIDKRLGLAFLPKKLPNIMNQSLIYERLTCKYIDGWMREFNDTFAQTDRDHSNEVNGICGQYETSVQHGGTID